METMFVCKTFAAVDAYVRPLSCVYSGMRRKMVFEEKRLPTL